MIKKIYLLKVIILFIFVSCSIKINAQQIYLENGVSISSIGKSEYESSYQVSLGVNYLHGKNYFLTTNIGYVSKGGKFYYADNNTDKFINNSYITFSMLFNLSKKINNSLIYIGLGPRYDVRVNRNNAPEELNWSKNNLFGLKISTGLTYLLSDFLIGFDLSYLPSFTNYLTNSNAKDRTFTVGGRLGFIF